MSRPTKAMIAAGAKVIQLALDEANEEASYAMSSDDEGYGPAQLNSNALAEAVYIAMVRAMLRALQRTSAQAHRAP